MNIEVDLFGDIKLEVVCVVSVDAVDPDKVYLDMRHLLIKEVYGEVDKDSQKYGTLRGHVFDGRLLPNYCTEVFYREIG